MEQDGAMAKTKNKMFTAYLAWKDRPEPVFTVPVVSEGDALAVEVLLIEGGDNEQELSAKKKQSRK